MPLRFAATSTPKRDLCTDGRCHGKYSALPLCLSLSHSLFPSLPLSLAFSLALSLSCSFSLSRARALSHTHSLSPSHSLALSHALLFSHINSPLGHVQNCRVRQVAERRMPPDALAVGTPFPCRYSFPYVVDAPVAHAETHAHLEQNSLVISPVTGQTECHLSLLYIKITSDTPGGWQTRA